MQDNIGRIICPAATRKILVCSWLQIIFGECLSTISSEASGSEARVRRRRGPGKIGTTELHPLGETPTLFSCICGVGASTEKTGISLSGTAPNKSRELADVRDWMLQRSILQRSILRCPPGCASAGAPSGVWGSFEITRRRGPVFRFGRNPTLRLFLSREIAHAGFWAVSRSHNNRPSAVLDHFGMKFGLGHTENMRPA